MLLLSPKSYVNTGQDLNTRKISVREFYLKISETGHLHGNPNTQFILIQIRLNRRLIYGLPSLYIQYGTKKHSKYMRYVFCQCVVEIIRFPYVGFIRQLA